ncbi:hypothetical protein ACQKFL_11215 [Vreelandella titanicae]|uniref:hypothetical protein n=1 Tax=Vreelandella titanicae TaxID=664683 RepID=UPI003D04355B|tara:strand:- start:1520 stop:1984 length:465 start_codon:yes stop_codon:yes gene_type:complete
MNYRNPTYTRNEGEINCEVEHEKFGWIPFTARFDDSEEVGRALYNRILQDKNARKIEVAPYVGLSNEEYELQHFRETATVSEFQAKQALDDFGYLDRVEALMADPETPKRTRRAWQLAREYRRLSPTVLEITQLLELPDEEVDELFRHALNIEA